MRAFLTILASVLFLVAMLGIAGFFDWITYLEDKTFRGLLNAWLIRGVLNDKLCGKFNYISGKEYFEVDGGDIDYTNGYCSTCIFRHRSGFVAKTSLEDVLYLRRAIIQLKKDQKREALERSREKSKEVSELMKKARGK